MKKTKRYSNTNSRIGSTNETKEENKTKVERTMYKRSARPK